MSQVTKTLRIDESVNDGLKLLGKHFGTSVNALIGRALERFLNDELSKAEDDLSVTLESLRAYRRRFTNFDASLAAFASAEAALKHDPAEGEPFIETDLGVASRMVDLLNG
jgi:hypothetical protein